MIPDEIEALVLADSVGALEPDERLALRERLEALTPEQRSEVARIYDTGMSVALNMPPLEAPGHMRDRVLAESRKPVRYTLSAANADWFETGLPGIRGRVLSVDRQRSVVTMVFRVEPGAVSPAHRHHGPEECFVISGSVNFEGRVLRAGDFSHADKDSEHGEMTTTEGAEVLVIGAIEDYLPGAINQESD